MCDSVIYLWIILVKMCDYVQLFLELQEKPDEMLIWNT